MAKRMTDEEQRARGNAARRARYAADPEPARARARAWQAANPEHIKAYRAANRERDKARGKARYEANRERNNAASRAWRAANPEQVKANNRAWRAANPEQVKAVQRIYQAANSERRNDQARAWRAANLERARTAGRVHYLHKRHGLTPEAWAAMWQSQDGLCYLCDEPLAGTKKIAVDHDHDCCPRDASCRRCRRGLAHNKCNTLIGQAGDDPERLRLIADNLEAAKARVAAQPPADEELVLFELP